MLARLSTRRFSSFLFSRRRALELQAPVRMIRSVTTMIPRPLPLTRDTNSNEQEDHVRKSKRKNPGTVEEEEEQQRKAHGQLRAVPESRFRVATLNILASNLAKPMHFPYVMPEKLEWSHRRQVLMSQLDALNADIVCLQELSDYWTFFREEMHMRGYESVYVKRPSINVSTWSGEGKKDGCGVFFKRNAFELVDCDSVNYNDVHDRVAMLALLKHKTSQRHMFVSTTHLWWNIR